MESAFPQKDVLVGHSPHSRSLLLLFQFLLFFQSPLIPQLAAYEYKRHDKDAQEHRNGYLFSGHHLFLLLPLCCCCRCSARSFVVATKASSRIMSRNLRHTRAILSNLKFKPIIIVRPSARSLGRNEVRRVGMPASPITQLPYM